MHILLKRIVEQQGVQGQYYDLGVDFSNFRRMLDGADGQIQQRFEQAIGAKLIGKRVRAKASRGYKQFVKNYEFDVTKITIDDYYDNFVVVAYDNTTPKPKEYFLKSGFKVEILGPATGAPSPQKGGPEPTPAPTPNNPTKGPNMAQHQPMAYAPPGRTPKEEEALKESDAKEHTGYSVEAIEQDIKPWLPTILSKPETAMRDFIKGLGWIETIGRGKTIAVFELKIPTNTLRIRISPQAVEQILHKISKDASTISTTYKLKKMELNETKDEWRLVIVKHMTDKSVIAGAGQ